MNGWMGWRTEQSRREQTTIWAEQMGPRIEIGIDAMAEREYAKYRWD